MIRADGMAGGTEGRAFSQKPALIDGGSDRRQVGVPAGKPFGNGNYYGATAGNIG